MASGGNPSAKEAFAELSRPGPNSVLRGELALVGLPGSVFTPASGAGLPAVVVGHDWLQPVGRYDGLLRHLASWGMVVVAPSTEGGPIASPRRLAHDMRTALTVCSTVRLGGSSRAAAVSVDPKRLGAVGHGLGGAAAVLSAASPAADTRVQAIHEPYWETGSDVRVAAVVTVALAESSPSAQEAARAVHVPGLHLAFGRDLVARPAAGAEPVARAWAGPSTLRTLKKATHLGPLQGRHWSDLILDGKREAGTAQIVRALLTGFLRRHLAGEDRWSAVIDGPVRTTEVRTVREEATVPTVA